MLAIMKNDYDLFAFFTRFQSYDNLWVNITIIAWPTHTHTHSHAHQITPEPAPTLLPNYLLRCPPFRVLVA